VEIPQWLTIVLAVTSPVTAFIGAIVGHWYARRSARELDAWRHREETMRLLRWAVERVVAEDSPEARAGMAALGALKSSELLQPEDLELVVAVTDALLEEPTEAYDALAEGNDPVDVEIVEEDAQPGEGRPGARIQE
jgi:hypothetical protein